MFEFLTIGTVALCFLGVVVGIVFGFLPGLSATMGVALMMPFTFGMPLTSSMALLLGICATVNIFAAPGVGKLTDRFGYRNIMIWDTVILCGVCLLYGVAGNIFPAAVALAVVCINFLLDAVISTTSLATNIYVREIASNQDELTSTLSTGISINHLIAILSAPLGGWVWQRFGIGVLFSFAAVMAVCNSLFAATLPKPKKCR